MKKVYAYSGTHGTGKTTAAMDMVALLKRQYPDKSIFPVIDQERFCPYPINKEASPEAQLWIFTRIINRELSYLKCYDILVSDRTAVDAVAYTYVLGFQSLAADMLSTVLHHMGVYGRIVFRKIMTNRFCHKDGIRETDDPVFRKQVEDTLEQMYDSLIDNGALQAERLYYE